MLPYEFYICENMDMKRAFVSDFSPIRSSNSLLKSYIQERLQKRSIPITNQSDLGETKLHQ